MTPCSKHPTSKRYASGNCAACAVAASTAWRLANPEKVKAFTRRYHRRHRAQLRVSSAAWHRANPEKSRALNARWRKQNPERVRHHSLKRAGFTLKLLDTALVLQRHRCPICCADLRKVLAHADHNHRTKKARGVLCLTCNTGLGKFADSAVVLRRAIAYLKRPTLKGRK